MKYALFFCLLLTLFSVKAQVKTERSDYGWDNNPVLTDVSVADTNISVYILRNFMSREFTYTNGLMVENLLIHKKVKLLTNSGISEYNKIYFPVFERSEITVEKARLVNSAGVVRELNQADIKEGLDEKTESTYRYFAIDGADINSEIEYIFMYRKDPDIRGNVINVQNGFPQKNYYFELICPEEFTFNFKSYNGLPQLQSDTTLLSVKKNRWMLSLDSVEMLKDVMVSAYDADLMKFGYKLTKSDIHREMDMFSYGELSEIIHTYLFANTTKEEAKLYNKIIKDIDLKGLDEEHKIRKIESYVKERMSIMNYSFPDGISIVKLWGMKVADATNSTKIFANLFKLAGIKFETVLTCDRFKAKFDPEFELWTYATDFVFYFPEIDLYTTPLDYDRLGFPGNEFIYNYGLFIKNMNIAGEDYGVGEVKFIPSNDYKLSGDTIIINADIATSGFDDVTLDIYHSVCGYRAQIYQVVYELISDEKFKKEIREGMVNFLDADCEITDLVASGFNSDSYGLYPTSVQAKIDSDIFFEKAQDLQLFRIGELIGPQMEMYDNEERKIPVEDSYNKHYYREINFTIPDGYKVNNLDDLNTEEIYNTDKEQNNMLFKSSYTLDGNKVKVIIEEYYKDLYHPVEIYDDYRRVVNASADFNKIVLIFSKI